MCFVLLFVADEECEPVFDCYEQQRFGKSREFKCSEWSATKGMWLDLKVENNLANKCKCL